MSNKSVAIALSGGVDSSVAAFLLKQKNYDVMAMHMILFDAQDIQDSELLWTEIEDFCKKINIPLYQVDLRNKFKEYILDYFCREYGRGLTPNPCIFCNYHIKFGFLMEQAFKLGAEFLATGHYARLSNDDKGYHLLKGQDSSKDQSYMLYQLQQTQLARIMFPLGNLSKKEVISIAQQEKFSAANRRSSQDLCFFKGKYTDFLKQKVETKPGEIVDIGGKIVGSHRGLIYYTIGQRCGREVSASRRLYVIKIDSPKNKIVIGTEEELYRDELEVKDLNWISGSAVESSMNVDIKIRYKSEPAKARLLVGSNRVKVIFDKAQRAISPGQAAVFYQDNEVAGGGIIDS